MMGPLFLPGCKTGEHDVGVTIVKTSDDTDILVLAEAQGVEQPEVQKPQRLPPGRIRHNPEAIRHAFESGEFPYKSRLGAKLYEDRVIQLKIEFLKVQNLVKETGERIEWDDYSEAKEAMFFYTDTADAPLTIWGPIR
jgi:polyphosphate kinase 2 (PPK2 family)